MIFILLLAISRQFKLMNSFPNIWECISKEFFISLFFDLIITFNILYLKSKILKIP